MDDPAVKALRDALVQTLSTNPVRLFLGGCRRN
jgi:hypothetical protein